MKISELRHLDEIKGNFGLGDGVYYRASAKTTESSPPPLLISSTLRSLVEQQQYYFDMLWRKAIPTKKRMKEIEGLEREFIETIQDPREILDLIPKLLSSSTEEIQLIISNKETYQLFENEIKLTSLLREQLREGNHIRVIIHGEKNTEDYNPEDEFENLYQLQRDNPNQLETQLITSVVYDRLNVFISDREILVIVESNKLVDNKLVTGDDLFESLGLAIYSNSESTVSSYATIFDTLWIRSSISTDNHN